MPDPELTSNFQRLLDAAPPAIDPFYAHIRNSEPLVLYKGMLEIATPARWAGRRLRGSIALHWLPTPHVNAHYVLINATLPDIYRTFDERGITVKPVAAQPPPQRPRSDMTPRSRSKSTTIHGSCALSALEIGDGSALTEVRLHIANFPSIRGRSVSHGDHLSPSRLLFSWNGWCLTMDGTPTAAEARQDLDTSSGYRLTHTASLKRTGGEEFSADAAQPMIDAFSYLLMFASGANCGPILPVGFSSTGHPAWARWATPGVQPWRSRFMWLDDLSGAAQLEALFPVFLEKWNDPLTQAVLRRVFHYYVASSTPPSVDASLVLAFVALELLERLVLPDIAGDADSRVRRMLQRYNIPLEVPNHLRHLLQVKNRHHWNDAAKTLAEMRHRIVHPDLAQLTTDPRADPPVDARVEAWLLVVRYVELLVLAILGYDGPYRSRISRDRWAGAVEPVPWERPLES
jgi:hypothetical protein